jgi:hypothetical protein
VVEDQRLADLEKQVIFLQEQYREQHKENKMSFKEIMEKLNSFPCERHLGERHVLETRIGFLEKAEESRRGYLIAMCIAVLGSLAGTVGNFLLLRK